MKDVLLVGMFFWIVVVSQKNFYKNRRIIAGVDAPEDRYPYVVAIARYFPDYNAMHRFCTGSLIASTWVLTAAHCFKVFEYKPISAFIIMFGNVTTTPNKHNSVKILQAIPHTHFHKESLKNDIGLLLVEHVNLKKVGKVSSIDYMSLIGYKMIFVGAGNTFTDEEDYEDNERKRTIMKKDSMRPLQVGEAVAVPCRDERKLDVIHERKNIFKNALICLRARCSNTLERSQTGDSGGPLLYSEKIVGVSHGHNPSLPHEFFYTAVSPHLHWIVRTVSTERYKLVKSR